MTTAVWVIGITALLAVGLAYLIGDALGQARGHARGYVAGQHDRHRAAHQQQRNVLREHARAAEEAIEYLYERARDQIWRQP